MWRDGANGGKQNKKTWLRLALLAAAAGMPAAARAQLAYTWDSSGNHPSAPVDGSGNWDTTSSVWSNGSSDVVWPNDNSIAAFGNGGAAGTVTLQTAISAGYLVFNPVVSGSYSIASGGDGDNLTLNGNAYIATNTNAAISAPIAGSVGLTLLGTGTLNLSGANTYTGTTTINSGTLQLGAAGTLPATAAVVVNSGGTLDVTNQMQTIASLAGTGNVKVDDGGSLTLNETAAMTFPGTFSGSGAITKTGTSVLTLTAASPAFTGSLNLTGTASNIVVMNAGANLNNGSVNITNSTVTGGAGPAFDLNSVATPITAPISYNASTGGDYRLSIAILGGTSNAIASNINIAYPTTATTAFPSFVISDNVGNVAISSAITVNSDAADGQLAFRGASAQSFTGAIHAPSTVIIATTDAGSLNFAPQAGSTWGTTGIGGTYTLAISSDSAIAGSANVAGGSNGIIFGGGRLQFNNYTSNLSFGDGNVSSTSVAIGLGAAAGAPSTYTGSISLSGSNGLNFYGPGTLILASSGLSYSGATGISGGTLQLTQPYQLSATGGLTIAAGATLDLQDNPQQVKSLAGAGNLLLTGPDSNLATTQGSNTSFTGNISGAGSLTESGGSLTLSGNNTYTGPTSINGTVILGSATAIPANNDVSIFGGTLTIGAFNTTLGSLQGFGTITGSGSLTVGSDNNSQIYGGQINTTGSLTLVGSSTFQVAGNTSTYTGGTNINSGTLQLGATNPLPVTTTLNIASGGTFDLNSNNQQIGALTGTGSVLLNGQLTVGGAGINSTFSGSISGGGTLIVAEGSNNSFTPNGSNSYTGGTQLVSGALAIASDAPVSGILSGFSFNGGNLQFQNYTSNLSFNNVSNLTLGAASGAASTLAGAITGGNGLNYAGPGTLILTSTGNNYSGGTMINGGNLQFAAGALPSSGQITITAGGALNLAGAFTTVASALPSISGSSTGAVALMGNSSENINFTGYNNLALGAAVNSTYTGTITPSGGNYNLGGGGATLTLPNTNAISGGNNLVIGSTGSAGTVVLAGSNNFTGSTTLNGGVLAINSDAAINSGAGGLTFAGGTLQFNNYTSNLPAFNNDASLILGAATGTASTLNSAITGSSALTYNGPGTLILASTGNNYSGPTTINAGTLALGAAGALPATTALTVNAGGSLDLNGNSQTVASLAGTGNVITETGATLTLGAAGSSTLVTNISGAGGLTKNNSGTLTINSALALTGPVNVTQTVTTGATAIVLSGNGSINSASSLTLSNTNTAVTGGANVPALSLSNLTSPVTVPINITLPTITGDYRATISNPAGANTISGPITLTAGNSTSTVNFTSTVATLTVSSTITDNDTAGGQLVFRGAATAATLVGIFNGSIGGPGSASLTVAKTDPDTWLWEPTGTPNWAVTTIGVGVFKMGEANALPATGTVMIGGTGTAGVTLDLNGFDQTVGGLSLVSTTPTTNAVLVTNTSATPVTLTINTGTGNYTYGQTDTTITGPIAINITGAGTQTINTGTQANTYTGGTTLTSGTLIFNALPSLGTGPVTFNGGTLQYSGSANTADITANGVTINSGGATINTNGASPTYASAFTGNGPFTKTGAGTLTLSAPQTLSAATAAGGTLRLAGAGSAITGILAINNSGTLEIDANTTAGQLRGDGTGTLTIVAGTLKPTAQAGATLDLANLSLLPTGVLDLGNGNLAINYGIGNDPIAAVVAYIKNGYHNGNWNGSSSIDGALISSAAIGHATALGYADNTTLDQVQVKYTWYGDLNLDGVVNNADLSAMGTGTADTWTTGDLNYDGVVNADDYALFMYGNASQNGSISAGVPEPASAALAIFPLAAGFGVGRRRRRSW